MYWIQVRGFFCIVFLVSCQKLYGASHEKIYLRVFQPGHTQTSLLSFREKLESLQFTCIMFRYDTFYTDPKWKLYIVFKSIYFDDKLSFGVNFFGHRIFNVLSISLKKLLDENQKLHNFMNNSVQRGSKWKFLKTIIPVTQILETRNYWLRALSDVKKIISKRMPSRIRHLIEFTLYEHVRNTHVMLTEVHIGVI